MPTADGDERITPDDQEQPRFGNSLAKLLQRLHGVTDLPATNLAVVCPMPFRTRDGELHHLVPVRGGCDRTVGLEWLLSGGNPSHLIQFESLTSRFSNPQMPEMNRIE